MDFSAYLSQLGSEQLDRLYDSPWTCQAVLRSLPPLCQHFVLQQLFLAEPLPVASVHAGVKQSAAAKRDAALAQLLRLQVLPMRKPCKSLQVDPPPSCMRSPASVRNGRLASFCTSLSLGSVSVALHLGMRQTRRTCERCGCAAGVA